MDAGGEYRVGLRTWLAIIALALANCNATLANTTNTIIKYQVMALGGADVASWIANGNFLMTLACAPIFGSLADRLGKKWFIVGGCAFGVIGSFLSSSANNVHTIIGGNILTGLANAGCIVSIAANQEIIPNSFRAYAFGFAQTVNSIAAVVGVFLAAVFAQNYTWAWSYRFNGIAYAVAGVAVLLTYCPPPTQIQRTSTLQQIIMDIDYIGMLLFAGSVACLVVGLTWGGSAYAWNSAMIIGLLCGGCIGLLLFGLFEWLGKKSNALLDHRLFGSGNFPILCFICLVDGMLLLGVNVLYAQEIAALFPGDAVHIAVILAPYLVTSTAGCLPAGILMGKTRSYRGLLIGALLWTSLFTGLMALLTSSRLSWAYAFSALFGVGTAVTTVIPIVALTLSVPAHLLGTAGTLSISARALGGIVGVTIFTAIYENTFSPHLVENVGQVLQASGDGSLIPGVLQALSSPAPPAVSLGHVPGLAGSSVPGILAAVSEANAESYKYVWAAIATIVAIGAVASCFLRPVGKEMTSHVESALETGIVRDQQMEKKLDI